MTQPRQPQGVPIGGQFVTSRHDESEVSLTSPHMERFQVYEHPPQQILGIGRLVGAAETTKPGPSWAWWAQQHWENIDQDAPLLTAQQDLRGDDHVDRFQAEIRENGIESLCPPPPTEAYLDELEDDGDLDINQWPHLVRIRGEMWVIDGHHRLAAASAEGATTHVVVADLDALAAQVAASEPWDMPDSPEWMLDHITEDHLLENDAFGDPDIVDENDPDTDSDESVTYEQLIAWHSEAHELGLSAHRHE